MNIFSIAILAELVAAPLSAQQPLDFDQGQLPVAAVAGEGRAVRAGIEITQDCAMIDFAAGDGETSSEKSLESQTIETSCWNTPPIGCVPQRRVIWRDIRDVTVKIPGRDSTAVESMSVCLQGRQLRLNVRKSPYTYGTPAMAENGNKVVYTLKRELSQSSALAPGQVLVELAPNVDLEIESTAENIIVGNNPEFNEIFRQFKIYQGRRLSLKNVTPYIFLFPAETPLKNVIEAFGKIGKTARPQNRIPTN